MRQNVGSLRCGLVQIVVHVSHVVQIEETERVRCDHRCQTGTEAAFSPSLLGRRGGR
ncbi:MAG: YezD family protein [Verrucomicrobiota bacterium]